MALCGEAICTFFWKSCFRKRASYKIITPSSANDRDFEVRPGLLACGSRSRRGNAPFLSESTLNKAAHPHGWAGKLDHSLFDELQDALSRASRLRRSSESHWKKRQNKNSPISKGDAIIAVSLFLRPQPPAVLRPPRTVMVIAAYLTADRTDQSDI